MLKKKILYLASPYGFTDSGTKFMENEVLPILIKKFIVKNPWAFASKYEKLFQKILKHDSIHKQKMKMKPINMKIGKSNQKMIDESDYVLAILDGTDVDSGVASEIGYAFAKKKKVFGYRNDWRQTGDNIASIVNLQVEFFIQSSGGKIFRTINELESL